MTEQAKRQAPYLFRNASIFDGTGRAPFSGDVFVEDGRIAAVGADGDIRAARDPSIVECAGRTLMPGLIEPHGHLSFVEVPSRGLTTVPVEEHILMTVRIAREPLACGRRRLLHMMQSRRSAHASLCYRISRARAGARSRLTEPTRMRLASCGGTDHEIDGIGGIGYAFR